MTLLPGMQLTRLLEDSLGSSSKCVLVVNVSPSLDNVAETKCSLEFAARARKVRRGSCVLLLAHGACFRCSLEYDAHTQRMRAGPAAVCCCSHSACVHAYIHNMSFIVRHRDIIEE